MNFDDIMKNVWADVRALMPEHVERLSWSREQVRGHQTKQLRKLLRVAKDKTKYYGEILADIDVDNFAPEDLHSLPPHDKIAHMDRWDEFVAVPDVTYEQAEAHLEKLRRGEITNPFFDKKYLFVSTGGSTGKRGMFLWDMNFLRQIDCYIYRCLVNDEQKNGYTGPFRFATVEAPTLIHGSPYVFNSRFLPDIEMLTLASTDPIPEVCEKLNDYQPTHLVAYASSVAELSAAQLKGMLNIRPRWVNTNSGPQDADIRDRTLRAWGTKASSCWGCCEIGIMAVETWNHQPMVTCDDGAIFEVVDKNNMPVTNVDDAAKVLATNLTNFAMPMIRYEVDDIIEIGSPLSDYPGYRTVTRVLGKATFWFEYGSVRVHPTAFSDILEDEREVEEFQIVQTPDGAHIKLVCGDEPDIPEIKAIILDNLRKYGLKDAKIDFEIVDSLPHHPETGKIKRFISL